MDPDTINCMILRIYVVLKKILAMPSSNELVKVQGMGEKKTVYSFPSFRF